MADSFPDSMDWADALDELLALKAEAASHPRQALNRLVTHGCWALGVDQGQILPIAAGNLADDAGHCLAQLAPFGDDARPAPVGMAALAAIATGDDLLAFDHFSRQTAGFAAANDGAAGAGSTSARLDGHETLIAAPILIGNQRCGVLCFSSAAPRAVPFSADERRLVRLMASMAASMMAPQIMHRREHLVRDELERSNALLRESNQALTRFAGAASHDLREPLRKITAFGEILERDYARKLDERGREFLGYMTGAADRMSHLIGDVLHYARLAGSTMREEPVDLDALLDETLEDLELSITETGAFVEASDLPSVLGDRAPLRSVFQNLIENALKYRCPSRRLRIRIEAETRENWVDIRISDNGLGFPDDQSKRILEPFHRAHRSSDRTGSGIGLALVKDVIERHGGEIEAIGRPGQGAQFHFSLPLADGASAQADGASAQAEPNSSSARRILAK